MNTLRTILYAIARLLGDLQALLRGPEAVGRRIQRRILGRMLARLFR